MFVEQQKKNETKNRGGKKNKQDQPRLENRFPEKRDGCFRQKPLLFLNQTLSEEQHRKKCKNKPQNHIHHVESTLCLIVSF